MTRCRYCELNPDLMILAALVDGRFSVLCIIVEEMDVPETGRHLLISNPRLAHRQHRSKHSYVHDQSPSSKPVSQGCAAYESVQEVLVQASPPRQGCP